MMRIQKLQAQLKEQQNDLQEKEYERYISDQQDMLDKLFSEYESLINAETKNRDRLLQKGIDAVNLASNSITQTIGTYADKYNYTDVLDNIESGLTTMIDDSALKGITEDVLKSITEPTGTIPTAISGLNLTLSNGFGNIASLIQQILNGKATSNSNTNGSGSGSGNDSNTTIPKPTLNSTPKAEKASVTDNKDLKNKALDFILGSATKPDKNKKEYSATNQNIWDLTKGKILTVAKMKELSKILSVTYDNAGKSGNLYKKLKSLGIKGFKHGGIAKLVKDQGEDGIGILQNGEGLIAPEHVPQIQSLLDTVPIMNDLTNKLVKLPDLSGLQPINSSNTIGDVEFNITLPNVTNYEDFKNQLAKDMANSSNYEKFIQNMTINRINGSAGRLTKNTFTKF